MSEIDALLKQIFISYNDDIVEVKTKNQIL